MTATPTDGWDELARRVADGVRVADGTRLAITVTGTDAEPAAEALVRLAHQRGATPQVVWVDERFDRAALKYATESALATAGPLELLAMEWADAYVALRAMVPPGDTSEAPIPRRRALLRSAKGEISTARWQQTRWAIVRIPTPRWAQFAELDEAQLRQQFFDGCLVDWEQYRNPWRDLATRLEETGEVRIQSEDTDLTLDVTDRRWVVFAGEANFPDGEIATAPLEHSASGHITFPHRFCFADEVIENLRLEFHDGEVTAVDARRGQRIVEELLATDAGARRVGELGIGLNPTVVRYTGDLFFDEKILGTVHLALGRAYPECGGLNRSTLHWDIVKDLRGSESGRLSADTLELISDGQPTENLAGPTAGGEQA